MDVLVDPQLQPPTPAPTDSLYPSTAMLASLAYYTALTTQATSAVPSSAHLSMPSLVSCHSASNASLVCQLPTPDPKPEDEDTVLIFLGNNLPYKQLTMRLTRIERCLSEMEHMHLTTCCNLGHAAATNTQNLLEVCDGMYDMLTQVSTSVDGIYEYLTRTGQFCDKVNTSSCRRRMTLGTLLRTPFGRSRTTFIACSGRSITALTQCMASTAILPNASRNTTMTIEAIFKRSCAVSSALLVCAANGFEAYFATKLHMLQMRHCSRSQSGQL
jgi:hypothetical protein